MLPIVLLHVNIYGAISLIFTTISQFDAISSKKNSLRHKTIDIRISRKYIVVIRRIQCIQQRILSRYSAYLTFYFDNTIKQTDHGFVS